MKISLNLNDRVNMELTDSGVETLREYYIGTERMDYNKKQKMPIWQFAKIFGSKFNYVNTHNSQQIVNNEIVIEKHD